MNYIDETEALVKKDYETTIDDYYEFLMEDDRREVPARRKSAKERFIFQIAVIAIIAVIVLFVPQIDRFLYVVLLGCALVMAAIFVISYYFMKDNSKNIEGLLRSAKKKHADDKEKMSIAVMENGIVCTVAGEKWVIKPADIEDAYETQNLFVVKVRDEKDVAARDIGHFILPKKVLSEEDYEKAKSIIAAMIKGQAKVPSK